MIDRIRRSTSSFLVLEIPTRNGSMCNSTCFVFPILPMVSKPLHSGLPRSLRLIRDLGSLDHVDTCVPHTIRVNTERLIASAATIANTYEAHLGKLCTEVKLSVKSSVMWSRAIRPTERSTIASSLSFTAPMHLKRDIPNVHVKS